MPRLPLTRELFALVPEGQHIRLALILAMLHMLLEYLPCLKFAMMVAAGSSNYKVSIFIFAYNTYCTIYVRHLAVMVRPADGSRITIAWNCKTLRPWHLIMNERQHCLDQWFIGRNIYMMLTSGKENFLQPCCIALRC